MVRLGARVLAGFAIAAGLLLAACNPAPHGSAKGGVDAARLNGADADQSEWMSTGRTYSEQRFSPLTQVNASTVGKLGLAWHYQFDTDRGQEATPLMVDGVLYTTTAWSKVFAFDAKTGKLLWSFDPKVDPQRGFSACCDVVNRGVAVWNGKVYVGALDGRLIALDAKTGAVVWSTQTFDPAKPSTITGAPRIVKGKVLIGNGGAEYGVRGYLSAYDAVTGKLVWRFYTTPNANGAPDGAASDAVLKSKATATWGGGVPQGGGGGTVWDSIAYDPDLNLVYFGVGNGTPWNPDVRSKGNSDNLFIASIVAVNADTGQYAWHFQSTPGEAWDYDANQHMILADLTIDGKARKVLMQACKNGFFYVLDRGTGQFISAKPYTSVTWAKGLDPASGRPIENPDARYRNKPALVSPAPYGGHNWQPMSYDAKQGLVFIPAMDSPFEYGKQTNYAYREGAWNLGLDFGLSALPDDAATRAATKALLKGRLIAWDPVKQEARWTVEHPYFWNAGVLATAGGLVFQGAAEGKFSAYDSSNGKLLWSYEVGNGVIAAPSTYQIDGEQYVAVMVGYGGAAALAASWVLPDRPRLPGRLMVFKLGGTATAPPYPKPAARTIDLTGVTSNGDVVSGKAVFHNNCAVCHGSSASGTFLTDLRTSPMLLTSNDFKSVVLDGALKSQGMVSFARYLTPKQVEDLRAYIISEARKTQAAAKVASTAGARPPT